MDDVQLAKVFLDPQNSTHRQYEALRAYFVEGLSVRETANRFGYTEGSFRVLACNFRKDPHQQFFIPPAKGAHTAPKKDKVREKAVALRKQNLSVYDISAILKKEGDPISYVAVSKILKEEGFSKLSRRKKEDRPASPGPTAGVVADVRCLDLSPRRFHTKFGGLFLFLSYLASLPLEEILKKAKFPGSKMIPALQAMLSLLALKLYGSARHSHVMSHVLDEGLAFFAGLNAIPKRSFLTEYSCRIDPQSIANSCNYGLRPCLIWDWTTQTLLIWIFTRFPFMVKTLW